MECKTPIKTELKQYDDYAINNNFTSITTNGPPMEFINNIDKESALRNQGIAKQKITIWAFVPSSRGDLYTPHRLRQVGNADAHQLLTRRYSPPTAE
jgi:hypothetical protein